MIVKLYYCLYCYIKHHIIRIFKSCFLESEIIVYKYYLHMILFLKH